MIEFTDSLTPNFRICSLCSQVVWNSGQVTRRNLDRLLRLAWNLEVLADQLGDRLRVLSGWRSPHENLRSSGSSESYHLQALAVDVCCPRLPPAYLNQLLCELARSGRVDDGGIGLYPRHVHYDLRCQAGAKASRWRSPGASLESYPLPPLRDGLAIEAAYQEGSPPLSCALRRGEGYALARKRTRREETQETILQGIGAAGVGLVIGGAIAAIARSSRARRARRPDFEDE